jgi:hypothetical protein
MKFFDRDKYLKKILPLVPVPKEFTKRSKILVNLVKTFCKL